MGIFNKILGNADGIRETTRDSYKKHVRMAESNPQTDDPIHWAGLYGAMASRYVASGNAQAEVYVWAELAPFLLMNNSVGLNSLCEYLVYKEQPDKANTSYIKEQINSSIRSGKGQEILALAATCFMNKVAWLPWLEPDTTQILTEALNCDI